VGEWFTTWSELQRTDFLPILVKEMQISNQVNGDLPEEFNALNLNSSNRPPSIFHCQVEKIWSRYVVTSFCFWNWLLATHLHVHIDYFSNRRSNYSMIGLRIGVLRKNPNYWHYSKIRTLISSINTLRASVERRIIRR